MSSIVTCRGCGTKNRVPDVATGVPRCPNCKTPLPWLLDAGAGEFDRLVGGQLPVLADMWAPWCGPCRLVGPAVEAAAGELAGALKVVRVNVDELPEVASRYGVQGIPTLILFRSGTEAARQVGALPGPALMQWLRSQLDAHPA